MTYSNYKEAISSLMEATINEGASDLHLGAGHKPAIRVSGSLLPLLSEQTLSPEDVAGFAWEILSPENKEIFLKKKEIDFSYSYKDRARFRGNCFFQQGKISMALRLIPGKIGTLAELNLPPILESFTQRQQGFFLVVGPIGQGKTTTLASMVDLINSERADHILTIEDPIEYIYQEKRAIIDQREVRIDTEDFHTALKSMFRQDVDVALIGEMRSYETMSAAVTAAETGHLIFSTLHTNNAAQTIDRIIDSFPPDQQSQIRVQLAASLTGIFSQRLIPKISGGMIPAYELLINNAAVGNLIRERRTHEINTVVETSSEQGMVDMNKSLAELARKGLVTIENARKYSNNPQMLDRLV